MAQYDFGRPSSRIDRRWMAIAALVALLLIAIGGALHLASREHTATDARVPAAPVVREGRVWVPAGPAALWPDDQMVAVGHTSDGETLYARGALVGGGGGMGPSLPQQAYLRVGDGQYQPVALVVLTR